MGTKVLYKIQSILSHLRDVTHESIFILPIIIYKILFQFMFRVDYRG